MNVRNFSLVLALVAMSASSVFAQGDFFWSFAPQGGGATNSAAKGNFLIGDTGSIYLYYDTANSQLDTGFFIDIASSMAGVVNITGLETFDFDIRVGGQGDPNPAINNRWGDAFGPGTVAGDGQSAMWNAFRVVNGVGILDANTGPVFFDDGYDAGAGAFFVGRLDFVAVGQGSTDLDMSIGAGLIVHNGMALNPIFGRGTINVVPEPTSAGLLALGLVGLVARRRR